MAELIDPMKVERVVGARRHEVFHIARADSRRRRVDVLHSARCLERSPNLLECPFTVALDRGIEHPTTWQHWDGVQDIPTLVGVSGGRLRPVFLPSAVLEILP